MTNKIENLENDDFLTVDDLPAEVRAKLGDDLDGDDLVEIDQLAGVMGLQAEGDDVDAYCTAGDFRAMLEAIRQDEIAKNPYGVVLTDDNITEADLPSPLPGDDASVVESYKTGEELYSRLKMGDVQAVRNTIEKTEDSEALEVFLDECKRHGVNSLTMEVAARQAELEDLQRDAVRAQSDALTDSFDRMLRGIDRDREKARIDDGAALR
jgi:hypothetical protein